MVTKAGRTVAKKQAAVKAAKTTAKVSKQARKSAKPVTKASQWKKDAGGFPLEVPSGNVCLARPVGMDAFLQKGIVPNSLRAIALEAVTKKNAPELTMEDVDEQKLNDMLQLFDAVTVYCVLEPKVTPAPLETIIHPPDDDHKTEWEEKKIIPIGDPRRDDDLLYVDEVVLEDKAFIFNFACGGTRNVEQFREEYASRMGNLSGGSDVAD